MQQLATSQRRGNRPCQHRPALFVPRRSFLPKKSSLPDKSFTNFVSNAVSFPSSISLSHLSRPRFRYLQHSAEHGQRQRTREEDLLCWMLSSSVRSSWRFVHPLDRSIARRRRGICSSWSWSRSSTDRRIVFGNTADESEYGWSRFDGHAFERTRRASARTENFHGFISFAHILRRRFTTQ